MTKQVSVANGNINDLGWAATPPGANTETLETTDMAKRATFSFTTPAASSTAIGNVSAGEASGGALDRRMKVSTDAGGENVLPNSTREASAPTVPFTVGHPIAGIMALQPSTQYFVQVENLQRSGGNLDIHISIKKPGSPQPI